MQSKSPMVRFDFFLPEPARRELHQLSAATGLSASDLARMGINRMLQDKDTLPKLPAATETIST
jgi:hypothetical protein